MDFKILSLLLFLSITYSNAADQTLYQYYTSGGIKSGLKTDGNHFVLNGKEIRIFSGSFHYFRVVPQYWPSVLHKFRAGGLNAVQFYSPWNLHEETPGNFDFESYLLNLRDFLKEVKAADMFAIARPGPFICGEWEFGGFPAWLLRDTNMHLRSNYKPYLEAVERYYAKIVPILHEFEFTNGGPVIALQIENEYGGIHNNNDYEYLSFLQQSVLKHGYKDLIFMSENGGRYGTYKNLPDVLHTANWMHGSYKVLDDMRKVQGNKPLFMTEFWSGWMDGWGDKNHHTGCTLKEFETEMSDVIFKANASINFYMYIGGTNFNFMNGGRVTTSYDYNSPLSEAGDITEKYKIAKSMFERFNKERKVPPTLIPAVPANTPKAKYGVVKPHDYLSLDDILNKVKSVASDKPKAMELLDLGANHGQHFGFILYRTTIQKSNHIKLAGGVQDRGIVLIDHKETAVVTQNKDWETDINANVFNANKDHTLDILVENTGRECGTDRNSNLKGLKGDVYLNKETKAHTGFKIYPLEFKLNFVNSLKTEKGRAVEKTGPGLYRAELDIQGEPKDTFMKLDNWQKGNVFVNGFNIGRYYHVGPQHTLYIPAPLLRTGKNDIYIFELHSAGNQVEFIDKPEFAPLDHNNY